MRVRWVSSRSTNHFIQGAKLEVRKTSRVGSGGNLVSSSTLVRLTPQKYSNAPASHPRIILSGRMTRKSFWFATREGPARRRNPSRPITSRVEGAPSPKPQANVPTSGGTERGSGFKGLLGWIFIVIYSKGRGHIEFSGPRSPPPGSRCRSLRRSQPPQRRWTSEGSPRTDQRSPNDGKFATDSSIKEQIVYINN